MKRGVRSLIVKLTLCTLAGAVVTWAVAWGLHTNRAVRGMGGGNLRNEPWLDGSRWSDQAWGTLFRSRGWSYHLQQAELVEVRSSWPASGRGAALAARPPLWEIIHAVDIPSPAAGSRQLERIAAGYPFLALTYTCVDETWAIAVPDSHVGSAGRHVVGGIPSGPLAEYFGDYLAVRPVLLGFALNTLLAAGVLLGVVECFALARRRVRRAKGRCAACSYDRRGLAGDAMCPECGA